MVPGAGVEPALPKERVFETRASTNSAIRAKPGDINTARDVRQWPSRGKESHRPCRMPSGMQGIIVAAGLGSRLGSLTQDSPKCLLEVAAKPMLLHQVEAMRACGISEIAVVVGYHADRFPQDLGVTYIHNPDYRKNNVLNSLMYARDLMDEGFLVSYSDLVYQADMVENLLQAPGPMAVSVDDRWKTRYAHLAHHPWAAMEKVQHDEKFRVSEIGIGVTDDAPAEFIGLFRCDAEAAQDFLDTFETVKMEYWGKPFLRSADFEKAYLTEYLQYLIDRGRPLFGALPKEAVWMEVDTAEDLEMANRLFA